MSNPRLSELLARLAVAPAIAVAPPEPAPIDKTAWRALADTMLRARPQPVRKAHSTRLAETGVKVAQALGARTVGVYSPLGSEVETRELAFALLAQGVVVAWPRLRPDGAAMDFAMAASPGELRPRPRTRLLEPPGPAIDPAALDLVVVPAVLLRPDFVRLGRGGGHFDRYLPRLRADAVKLGVAAAACVLPWGPVAAHDCAMDLACTEYGLWGPAAA
jgi:5-formyltetrahydrofolate cyclo-ligase